MTTLDDILVHCGLEKGDLVGECPRDIRIKLAVKLVDWKVFGAFLGFPPEKLASIDAENRTEDQRKIALLDSWHERECGDATSLKLAEVLYERNRRDLVCYLCHELVEFADRQGSASSHSSIIFTSGRERSTSIALFQGAHQSNTLEKIDSGDITDKIEELEEEFDALHKGLLSDIKANEAISAEEFLQALTLLPISLRREYERSIQEKLTTLERIPTINGMFLRLNPLFSFLDYGLLDHLIRKFGSHTLKQGMMSYLAKINDFMSETTVAQLMDCWPGLEVIPSNFSYLRVKFDEDPTQYTLKKLDRFRKKFCGHIRLSHFVLLLIRIESGSFYAIWCIPTVLVPDLVKMVKQISAGFYQYERILSITVDGDCIYFPATNTPSRQVVLFPLDQEYLTHKPDGFYEERDYRILGDLGSTVLAQDLTTHAQFSIQIIVGENSSTLNECHILSRLGKHRNVIHFLGGVAEELDSPTGPIQECRIMFESIKDGSLADLLTDEEGYAYPLDGNQALYYLHQSLSGVHFLHENNVLHLDICAENLQLFDHGRIIKLGGFERAMSMEANTGVKLKDSRHLSTFFCAAPEVIREEIPSAAADIWSVMCTMIHMITGTWPGCVEAPRLAVSMLILVGSYSDDLLHKLIPLDKLELDLEIAQLFMDVFKKDPSLRPTAKELLKRPMIHLAQDYYGE